VDNVLYWVRHGETESNLRREYATWRIDLPLTAKGRLQAAQTGDFFRDKGVAEIYCSPLKRARETAEIIGATLGLPVTAMEQFRESSAGDLEGLPINEMNRAPFARVRRAWDEGYWTAKVPGGECYQEMWQRMDDGIRHVLDGKDGKKVMVVSHMVLLTHVIKSLCPEVDIGAVRRQESFNCSVTEMTMAHDGARWIGRLERWVDVSHLSGEAADLVSFATASGKRET
jgi:broad specificity phosphatase PhoE